MSLARVQRTKIHKMACFVNGSALPAGCACIGRMSFIPRYQILWHITVTKCPTEVADLVHRTIFQGGGDAYSKPSHELCINTDSVIICNIDPSPLN